MIVFGISTLLHVIIMTIIIALDVLVCRYSKELDPPDTITAENWYGPDKICPTSHDIGKKITTGDVC